MTRSGSLVSRTWHEFSDDHCMLLSAGIAFYVLFSFVPLMTLALAVLGFIMRDPQSQQSVLDRSLQTMPWGESVIIDSIRSASSQSGTLSLIGLIGLICASTGIFGAVRSAMNIAWDVEPKHSFLWQQLLDVGAACGLSVLMVASMSGTILAHFVEALSLASGSVSSGSLETVFKVAGVVLPAAVSFVAFLLIYRDVPNVRHRTSDVWPGALLATVLFELSKHGFAYYVSHFNSYRAIYGVLGGVMLFMLWTYLAAIILMIGAEFGSEFEKGRRRPSIDDGPFAGTS